MATNKELDSGIVVTRLFRGNAGYRIQLNLRGGAYQELSLQEARELSDVLKELISEVVG
jgi:hypothetical protein